MVKHVERSPIGGPPPIDESWWEAVLAEDESHAPHQPEHPPATNDHRNGAGPIRETLVMDWDRAMDIYEADQTVSLLVDGYNRGGLLVSGDGLHGFVPISHLVNPPTEQLECENCLEDYLEKALVLKVIECDRERGRVVFSERAALSSPGSRNNLLNQIQPGDCIQGSVTNITDFGIFVDLGGIEGLVHVSEISWGRVHHPMDAVKLGQVVEVYVINIDRERARVALSLKRLRPNPWKTAEQRYHVGQVTPAIITSVVPFGAFARLEEGLDGLIHISEICPRGQAPSAHTALCEGQQVMVRVLHVDSSRQRLGLSLQTDVGFTGAFPGNP
jgi:small subunit ribosomal protein S1